MRVVPADKVVDSRFYVTRMLPVGFCMALTLVCGNTVYMYLTVAFIQMLKAFTPVITMLGLFLAALEVRPALPHIRPAQCTATPPPPPRTPALGTRQHTSRHTIDHTSEKGN